MNPGPSHGSPLRYRCAMQAPPTSKAGAYAARNYPIELNIHLPGQQPFIFSASAPGRRSSTPQLEEARHMTSSPEVSYDWLSFCEQTKMRKSSMVNNFRAGSLSEHTEFWSTLTRDYKISKVISTGIEIELHELPKQSCPPRQYQFTTTESAYIRSEIQTLLKKNVITVVKHCQGEYLSNVFLRPKKGWKVSHDIKFERF